MSTEIVESIEMYGLFSSRPTNVEPLDSNYGLFKFKNLLKYQSSGLTHPTGGA